MKKTKTIIILLVLLFFLILSFIFDKQIITIIQVARNFVPLETFFSFILLIEKNFIFYPLIIVVIGAILLWKKKELSLSFILSLIVSLAISILLKTLIARPRPFLVADVTKYSFPSTHTTAAFTAMPFLDKLKWIQIGWFILACLFAFTRIWFGLHYLSDVIAGSILGYGVGFFIKRIWEIKIIKK